MSSPTEHNGFIEQRKGSRRKAETDCRTVCQVGSEYHESIELRLQKIELEMNSFNDELNGYAKTISDVTESLNDIQRTLHSIKFMVFGALGIYAVQTVGIEGLIKQFIN